MNGQALSMEDAKHKLAGLEEYLPGRDQFIYDFASYLATRLNPELVPMGFVMACELVLVDIANGTGVDGFGRRIPSGLVGYPTMMYAILRMEIPKIVEAIFPEEFATDVKNFIEEVNRKMEAAK